MKFKVSNKVKDKLKDKHNVLVSEAKECFASRGNSLIDNREDHKTDPPTRWFIGQTNKGRKLKVVYIFHPGEGVELKSAFEPNDEEIRIYSKYGALEKE